MVHRHLRLGAGLGPRRRQGWLISTGIPARGGSRAARAAERAARRDSASSAYAARPFRSACAAGGPEGSPLRTEPPAPSHRRIRSAGGTALALRSSFTRPDYLDAVARVREYIYAGDIFQANLSQRFEAPLDEPVRGRSTARCGARNPAPFARLLRRSGRAGAERLARAVPARRCRAVTSRRGRSRARAPRGVGPGARRRARRRRSPRAPRTAPRT